MIFIWSEPGGEIARISAERLGAAAEVDDHGRVHGGFPLPMTLTNTVPVEVPGPMGVPQTRRNKLITAHLSLLPTSTDPPVHYRTPR